MDAPRTRSGVGENGKTAPAAECDVIAPVFAMPPAQMRTGIVVNRDHVVGFLVGAGLLAAAYWLFKKCED